MHVFVYALLSSDLRFVLHPIMASLCGIKVLCFCYCSFLVLVFRSKHCAFDYIVALVCCSVFKHYAFFMASFKHYASIVAPWR
jgi:hypothetical protein